MALYRDNGYPHMTILIAKQIRMNNRIWGVALVQKQTPLLILVSKIRYGAMDGAYTYPHVRLGNFPRILLFNSSNEMAKDGLMTILGETQALNWRPRAPSNGLKWAWVRIAKQKQWADGQDFTTSWLHTAVYMQSITSSLVIRSAKPVTSQVIASPAVPSVPSQGSGVPARPWCPRRSSLLELQWSHLRRASDGTGGTIQWSHRHMAHRCWSNITVNYPAW